MSGDEALRPRLLVFNLRTDIDDTALGFTTAWVNALARRSETVDVVTMHRGRLALAANVRVWSVGRERGYSRLRRVARFYRVTTGILVRRRPDVCFAHMTPLFASLFAPLGRLAGVPVLLWYAHGNVTRELKIAERLVDRCATSTLDGFQLPSRKLHVLGQGIDTERFVPPSAQEAVTRRTVLSLGRVTPAKRLDAVVRVVAAAREQVDLRLRVVGGAYSDADVRLAEELQASVADRGLDGVVEFAGPVPYDRIVAEYHRAGIFLNLSETGSLDKAILEAMASGCVPVSRNASFAKLADAAGFAALVPEADDASVVERLVMVASLDAPERDALLERLRALVIADHGLDRLAELIHGHLRAIRLSRRTRFTPRARARFRAGREQSGPGRRRARSKPRTGG